MSRSLSPGVPVVVGACRLGFSRVVAGVSPGRGWYPAGVDLDSSPRWPGVTVGLWSLGSRLVVSTSTSTGCRIFLTDPEPLVDDTLAKDIFTALLLELEPSTFCAGAFSLGPWLWWPWVALVAGGPPPPPCLYFSIRSRDCCSFLRVSLSSFLVTLTTLTLSPGVQAAVVLAWGQVLTVVM